MSQKITNPILFIFSPVLIFVIALGFYKYINATLQVDTREVEIFKPQTLRAMQGRTLALAATAKDSGWWHYQFSGRQVLSLLMYKDQAQTFHHSYRLANCQGNYGFKNENSLLGKKPDLQHIGVRLFDEQALLPALAKRYYLYPASSQLPSLSISIKKDIIKIDALNAAIYQYTGKYASGTGNSPIHSISGGRYRGDLQKGRNQLFVLFKDNLPSSTMQNNRSQATKKSQEGTMAYKITVTKQGKSCLVEVAGMEAQAETEDNPQPWTTYINNLSLSKKGIIVKEYFKAKDYTFDEKLAGNSLYEDQALFDDLNQQGLLRLDRNLGVIHYPLRDELVACHNGLACAKDSQNRPITEHQELLDVLYSPQRGNGSYLRDRIQQHNERRIISAVLLSNSTENDVISGLRTSTYIKKSGNWLEVPYQIHKQLLTIKHGTGLGGRSWSALRSIGSEHFEQATQKVKYQLTSRADSPKGKVSIVVFGEKVSLRVAGRAQSGYPLQYRNGQVGRRYNLDLRPNRVVTIEAIPLSCKGQCNYFKYDDKSPIQVNYDSGAMSWVPLPKPRPKQHKKTKTKKEAVAVVAKQAPDLLVSSADGQRLYQGRSISAQAVRLGLLNLLGVNHNSSYYLPDVLLRTEPPLGEIEDNTLSVQLTIDSGLQKVVHEVVQKRDLYFAKIDAGYAAAKENSESQLSVVLIDASHDKGAILAIAHNDRYLGDVQQDSYREELLTAERIFPETSPLRWLPAYQRGSWIDYPGSIFKIVTTVAIADQVQRLQQYGSAAARDYGEETIDIMRGLTRPALLNYGKQRDFLFNPSYGAYPDIACSGGSCTTKCGRRTKKWVISAAKCGLFNPSKEVRQGLARAVYKSHNPWFSWMLDRVTPAIYFRGAEEIKKKRGKKYYQRDKGTLISVQSNNQQLIDELFPLTRVMRRLHFLQTINLLTGQAEEKSASPFSAAYLQPVFVDKVRDIRDWRRMAIGYRVGVTPVHFAALSASVASNQIVVPHLIKKKGSGSEPLFASKEVWGLLKKGMDRVTKAGGTAPILPDKGVWAKTGTAYIRSKKRNITSMTGWFCVDRACAKQYSFACKIAPMAKGAGGTNCGKIMSDVIKKVREYD